MMTADQFTDTAILRALTQTGANDLGEPVFTNTDTTLKGLLVNRPKQYWTELGLVPGVESVFLTSAVLTEIPAGAVLIAGGKTYRNVTLSLRKDLWGDDGITRLILSEGV